MDKKNSFFGHIETIYQTLNQNILIMSIRESLVSLIPVLVIGTFALVCSNLPIPIYQNWMTTVLGGSLYQLILGIYQATYGMLSIYMTIGLSVKYSEHRGGKNQDAGVMISALAAFAIFSGVLSSETFNITYLGSTGMFTAIVCSLVAAWMYDMIYKRVKLPLRLYVHGTDNAFYHVIRTIIPVFVIVVIFAVVNILIVTVFDVDCFQTWFAQSIAGMFDNMGNSLGATILFVFSGQFMWFFGVHGSNVLDSTKNAVFATAMERNIEAVAAGGNAAEICTSSFLDTFVLMGGNGATWALLIALIFFGKRRSNRSLAKASAIPMVFNINEMLVFGLPIVCNPIFLIPYILTPIAITFTSYLATLSGLVPMTINRVEWTTPIFISGYLATGSFAGVILQIFNLVLGAAIYAPFVKMYDIVTEKAQKEKMNRLVDVLKRNEESREPIELLSLKNEYGDVAKNLADELELWIKSKDTTLYYQPQYNHKRELIGAEALLRWKHPAYGMMYPPLVIKLAEETGNLINMEKEVFRKVANDVERMLPMIGKTDHISVNVTGSTIQRDEFEEFLVELKKEYPEACDHIMIEITEQSALRIDKTFIEKLTRLRNVGYVFGIDDFSMGSTSIKYLQSNVFSLVKLDGEISRDIMNNNRSKEIVSSIAQLTHELGIPVLAEYVETEQQRQVLEDVGCYLYQGYLYSPAITFDEFMMKCLL